MASSMKQAVEAAGVDKLNLRGKDGGGGFLPNVSLGNSRLAKIKDAQEFSEQLSFWIAERTASIREWIESISGFIKLEWGKLQPLLDSVRSDERQLVEFLNSTEVPEGVRRVLAKAAFEAALEIYPRTFIGLEFLARLGHESQYLREVNKGVVLPVWENGRRVWKDLLPPHGHDEVVSALRKFVFEQKQNSDAEHEKRIASMKEGTVLFSEAIAKGGKALVRIPSERGGRDSFDGTVLVEVSGGNVSLLDADGRVAHDAKMMTLEKITIPVRNIEAGRFFSSSQMASDLFHASRRICEGLHRAFERSQLAIKFQARLEEFKKPATIAIDRLIEGEHGVAHMYWRFWKRGNPERTFRDINVLVERNDNGQIRVVSVMGDRKDLTNDLFKNCMAFAEEEELSYPLNAMFPKLAERITSHSDTAESSEEQPSE